MYFYCQFDLQLNKTIKIFTILLLAGFVSSCAKDELEEPSHSSAIDAKETVDHQFAIGDMEVDGVDYPINSTPSAINDDGDDEDEDRTLITAE